MYSGFSSKKFSSLNCSYSTDDQDIAVQKNILQAQKELLLDNICIKDQKTVADKRYSTDHELETIQVDNNDVVSFVSCGIANQSCQFKIVDQYKSKSIYKSFFSLKIFFEVDSVLEFLELHPFRSIITKAKKICLDIFISLNSNLKKEHKQFF